MHKIEDYNVTQANALVYGASSMTLREKRLFYLAVCKIAIHDNEFLTYRVSVDALRNYLGLNGKSIVSSLEQICDQLLSRVVRIHTEKGWIAHQYVSRCRYTKAQHSDDGEATLEIRLHEEVKPFLMQLQNRFQSIKFSYLNKISSIHAIRLFEILWHKRHVNKQIIINEITISLVDLRKMLGLEKKYTLFADFKRRVLTQSQKEISKNTPLKFSFSLIKKAQKVTAIRFIVNDNPAYNDDTLSNVSNKLLDELDNIENPKTRKKIISKHIIKDFGFEKLRHWQNQFFRDGNSIKEIETAYTSAVTEIDNKSKSIKPVLNPVGYMRNHVERVLCN